MAEHNNLATCSVAGCEHRRGYGHVVHDLVRREDLLDRIVHLPGLPRKEVEVGPSSEVRVPFPSHIIGGMLRCECSFGRDRGAVLRRINARRGTSLVVPPPSRGRDGHIRQIRAQKNGVSEGGMMRRGLGQPKCVGVLLNQRISKIDKGWCQPEVRVDVEDACDVVFKDWSQTPGHVDCALVPKANVGVPTVEARDVPERTVGARNRRRDVDHVGEVGPVELQGLDAGAKVIHAFLEAPHDEYNIQKQRRPPPCRRHVLVQMEEPSSAGEKPSALLTGLSLHSRDGFR
mmetsp:Transcript_37806/g.84467  ORF Transcript_37806/g.84467 Transcript_37806/m.84467 type:complete len:288 (+) Transcript_37806:392-1255(+)